VGAGVVLVGGLLAGLYTNGIMFSRLPYSCTIRRGDRQQQHQQELSRPGGNVHLLQAIMHSCCTAAVVLSLLWVL
jgi:hypothetical protein